MRFTWTFLFILYAGIASAQFTGGNKDGYDRAAHLSTNSIYTGGSSDGFDSNELINPSSIYNGGAKDGYHREKLNNSVSIYTGATEDGYATSGFNNTLSIYTGGDQDGYAMNKKVLSYFWTGAIDENWNDIGNWQLAILPNINSNVVIPAGVPHFPLLENGLMSIGQNPNGAIFFCKQISIRQGAQMTYNAAAFLENFGFMGIRGNVFVNNSTDNAWIMKNGATLIIYNQGSLLFQ